MAVLKFVLYDLMGNSFQANDVTSYGLSKNVDAACDGLQLTFTAEAAVNEFKSVKVFNKDNCIFNGLVDTQREQINEDGMSVYIYARSTASVLVDNEAVPFTYSYPSANSLYYHNARDFGFKSKLPELFSGSQYQVSKGTSCYGAINNFVYGICGKKIAVDVENNIYIPGGNAVVGIDGGKIISEKRTINRVKAISKIDYKANGSTSYCYHIKSRFFDERGISRCKKLNITSMPQWQQDSALLNALENAAADYCTVELALHGSVEACLYDRISYKSNILDNTDDYYISSIYAYGDKNGEYTRLTISKQIDLREVSYVAEQGNI